MKNKIKTLLKFISVSMLFLLIGLAIFSTTNTYKELKSRATLYVTLNKDQNWGIRKAILDLAYAVLSTTQNDEHFEFDKNNAEAGAKASKSDLSDYLIQAKKIIKVDDAKSIVSAIQNAKAGQVILILPGEYKIRMDTLYVKGVGTRQSPIVLAASQFGQVTLHFNSWEGILLDKPFWVIKNLIFKGPCEDHKRCQHAIHMTGNADNTVIDNNAFINYSAALKSNGRYPKGKAQFPDNVVFSNNDVYNTELRKSNSPASPIDVVGGDNWLLEGNFIADFSRKVRGRMSIVYGAFLKGGGSNGTIRNNVINCAWNLPYQSSLDIRLGLSLGDGGTGKKWCQVKDCKYEHSGGVISNNLIMNCKNDVSIYLNKAENTKIYHNVILNSLGVDARFPATQLSIQRNIIQGRVKARDGAFVSESNNTFVSDLDDVDMLKAAELLARP
ncbi:chondroitinase-B domain-containing protein [Aliiglaciecola sp. M165]|uniref:chondroitinase-B domain-containing protein n=1 Tax=Aliiglaciecola sp. M165 TaxID=2593649 RepID=UPI00118007D0|nr:chondroitinase-B domain-containing protein [Aliiglaciecola sp. M165]TRY30835.1 hypothetical protein FM019_13205 [Aliiglaciecola sp. M165]